MIVMMMIIKSGVEVSLGAEDAYFAFLVSSLLSVEPKRGASTACGRAGFLGRALL